MPGETNGRSRLSHSQPSPFHEVARDTWARLAANVPSPLTEADLIQLRGLGDNLDMREVTEVYLPLSRLLNLYVSNRHALQAESNAFFGESQRTTPFVIGVAGSVAVGKSTVARLLRELLSRWDSTPRVELVTTDGFLHTNDELERRGLLGRKGFPESYDRKSLLRFVANIKGGAAEVRAPYYSHLTYDIVPDAQITVRKPDVLIVEGLNVLQPVAPGTELAVSDFFDFSIYVDARTSDIKRWYLDRFLQLRRKSFSNPSSYFHRWADLTDDEASAIATTFWDNINEPNLNANILPTRSRANLVLRKEADHGVKAVFIRKL